MEWTFKFWMDPAVAQLCWVAFVRPADGAVRVLHGSGVEIDSSRRFFVEGAWAGPFGLPFDSVGTFFGSGACVSKSGALVFVSSMATTDWLFLHEAEGEIVVSNSLPALLAAAGDALIPTCTEYASINSSIVAGFRAYCRQLPTRHGHITRVMSHDLVVDHRGVEWQEKPLPPSFANYEEYVGYLETELARLFVNARDSRRVRPLAVWSTQSRGYDTTAVNALCAPLGVDRCFTVRQSKVVERFADEAQDLEGDVDDGTEICDVLGIPCVGIDRRLFASGDFPEESQFLAGLGDNSDYNLLGILRSCTVPTLLLTGCLGELWYPFDPHYADQPHMLDDTYRRWDLGNHGLTEVRLSAGVCQVAVPYIGARRRTDIMRITGLPDLDRWRIGGTYDRAIPRRIAEERGVPRSLFGRTKLASVVEFTKPRLPYGADLRTAFTNYLVEEGVAGKHVLQLLPAVHWVNRVAASPNRFRALALLRRAIGHFDIRAYSYTPQFMTRLNGAVFSFAVNLLTGASPVRRPD